MTLTLSAMSIISNHKNVKRTEGDKEYNRVLKEINMIDNRSNYGANYGLFNGKHKDEQNEDSGGESAI